MFQMQENDLLDLVKALGNLWIGMRTLGEDLPPERAERFSEAQKGIEQSIQSILDRHHIPTGDEP